VENQLKGVDRRVYYPEGNVPIRE